MSIVQSIGAWALILSAIARAEATADPPVAIPRGAVIPMDADWLARRGPGPYLLDQAGATYILHADVTTSGTAFYIAARRVTFDLNGHTITYNNAQPMTVPNGGFEADPAGSTTITAWDAAGAPQSTFRIVPNDVYLFGSMALQWSIPDGAGPQVIGSSEVAIPRAHRVYTASITPSAVHLTQRGVGLKLEVVDAVTGQVEANFTRSDTIVWQGGGPTFDFIPTTTHPVHLRVTARLGAGSGGATFELDRAVISRSMDYGIIASYSAASEFLDPNGVSEKGGLGVNGLQNLPTAIRSIRDEVYAPTIRDSVGTGQIRQGQAGGAFCTAIMAQDTRGAVRIDGVTTYTWGDDITPIQAKFTAPTCAPADARTISHCAVIFPPSGMNITVRSALYPAIDVNGVSPATVERCRITNNPEVGIKAGEAAVGSFHLVRDNVLRPNTVVTNGYAIFVASRTRVLNNTIDTGTTGSSRGIYIGAPESDIEIAGNRVDVRERGNREYGLSSPARAFRLRALSWKDNLTNIHVHDNVFIARTGPGFAAEAIGVRISEIPEGSRGIRFTHNTIGGIVDGPTDPGPRYGAKALVVDSSRPAEPILFENNTFESDDSSLQLGYSDAAPTDVVANLLFRNNRIRKTNEGFPRKFTSFGLGYWKQPLRDIAFFQTALIDGATADLAWSGEGSKQVDFGRVLTVSAVDAAGTALAGASVRVVDARGRVAGSGATDVRGVATLEVVTARSTGTTNPTVARRGPFTLAATHDGHPPVTMPVDLERETRFRITLEGSP